MAYKNGNYAAFYVSEPFSQSNLGAFATRDFNFYSTLKMWKGKDGEFPFIDSHDKTYNVRDGSDWEKTLKPRLRTRLRKSKNMILFLSSKTTYSRALNEEIEYGINVLGLPVIVVYPDFENNSDIVNENKEFKKQITNLWNNLPRFRDLMLNIPSLHIPMKKDIIKKALKNSNFMFNTKCSNGRYFYNS